ncbi:GNAT family N-acetyltransferase [Saccharibacillus alkalitolerans]|uniref:GNAT family N-acetyltransferase n=1 Tax=Saccharibacillus alkalitolerans TaxID=2705290 RepID=A0ABX0F9D5_9BACL|nr:GNAT family N-acetyltransferase [Saccharibacillus alkalitolerans]NGZ77556.1 GNAT family N-acetyltransferase [Saccharibacillus alkalitolerans]
MKELEKGAGEPELRWTWELPSAEELHDLYEALDWNDFLRLEPEKLRRAMEGSWRVVSVYAAGELAGTGRLVSDGVINAYLCGVGVREHWRSRGIGSEIVRRLTNEAARAGLHIQLFCSEEHRTYYGGLGFEEFALGMKMDGRKAAPAGRSEPDGTSDGNAVRSG